MSKQATVTAKVPEKLKRRLARLGVNVSELVREALEAEADRLEREKLRRMTEEASKILQKIDSEELVEAVREGRKSR